MTCYTLGLDILAALVVGVGIALVVAFPDNGAPTA